MVHRGIAAPRAELCAFALCLTRALSVLRARRTHAVHKLTALLLLCVLGPPLLRAQLSTDDHIAEPGFWPTKSAPSRDDFVGAQVCGSCHADKLATQQRTAMAQTAHRAADSEVLKEFPKLTFENSHIHYEIRSENRQPTFTVSDGAQSVSSKLLWAFGNGRVGQSYLYKQDDGHIYEARASFFATLHNLNFTPSRALDNPKDLDEAAARRVPSAEVVKCFSCHTTGGHIGAEIDEQSLVPGVSCEACHGPGAQHVAAAKVAEMSDTPDAARGTIYNAAKLSPANSVDFCGACHISYWDMRFSGATGVATSKCQPFRLQQSKCWGGKGDARITCVACHDPHQPLATETVSYDRNCLSCHVVGSTKPTSSQAGSACPKASSDCASCHMPKEFTPVMHYAFTDHRIRIVKPGENYPD